MYHLNNIIIIEGECTLLGVDFILVNLDVNF